MDLATPNAPNRRALLRWIASAPFACATAANAGETLTFGELYGKVSVLGLAFSDKVKRLAGTVVTIRGFMAPPLKAEAQFFVLTEQPMALCPFCSSDADWPYNIVVIYLAKKQTFVEPGVPIDVSGRLEMGSWTDPETGFVSQLRLRESEFHAAG